ncbi:aminotransferase class V-fold PLP-dependent enzyme [Actinomadura sp. WMMB 499]|uniref:aminotransferase class V-fold PLP-dependent enzyme n=1 Tax=Actinomadura sp. WMMB 499 TaxID=1219491 RepID=UPI00124526A9|nr:cysteine desulfurase [Actinomadura sp. WMMB 499]QFG22953.1 cysteine desulfurase [Actinomadura sp. WMMB 499]
MTDVRDDFPILRTSVDGEPPVYLDNAATTQKPARVLDAIVDHYATATANIGRSHHALARRATERYERARAAVQAALGAAHPEEIVFTGGTTDGINLLADTFGRERVGAGDEVVVCGMEHNSNLLPWRRLCERAGARLTVVPVDERGRTDRADFAAALGPRTRLAAVAHVSNVLGTVNPVREMIRDAHRAGVPVVVDGAQAVPHAPVDVRDLDADFYCFSAHKVYGPTGVGVLYGRRDLLAGLPPYRVGGGTVKGVARDEPVAYVPAPARLEAGTPDVAGAVGLAAALGYVADLGWDAVREHDAELVHRAVTALRKVPGARVVGAPEETPSGIVSFVIEGVHPYDVGGHLDRHGVAVRCGVHCASTFLDDLGLLGTVRLSFAVYNTVEEVDRAVDLLHSVRPGVWTAEHPTTRFL